MVKIAAEVRKQRGGWQVFINNVNFLSLPEVL